MHPFHVMALALLALPAVSRAEGVDSNYEKSLTKGIYYLGEDKYAEALEELNRALTEKPEDADAVVYRAIALSRLRDPEAETALKRALLHAPEDPKLNMELGRFYLEQKNFAEAADYLETVQRLPGAEEYADSAGNLLQTARKGEKGRAWNLRVSAGVQYDSNVILFNESNPLPEGISHKDDWRLLVLPRFSYTFWKNNRGEVSAGYGLYQSVHSRLSDFDVSHHAVDVSGRYQFSGWGMIRGAVGYEGVLLGGRPYDTGATAAISLIIAPHPNFATLIDYRFRDTNYYNTPVFVTSSDRNGTGNQAGIAEEAQVGKGISLRGGYFREWENTREAYLAYAANRFLMGITSRLPYQTTVDLSAEILLKTYEAAVPTFSTPRNETMKNVNLRVTKPLTPTWSTEATWALTRNSSNVAPFDYRRTMYGILLTARF